jgi:hypothetical protein
MKFIHQGFFATLLLLAMQNGSLAAEASSSDKSMSGMSKHGQPMTEEQKEQHLIAIQEYNLKMHDLSNQILAEKDPAKQEPLKVQQRQLMKEHYEKMRQAHKM